MNLSLQDFRPLNALIYMSTTHYHKEGEKTIHFLISKHVPKKVDLC